MNSVVKICNFCNNEFNVRNTKNGNNRRFCSKSCASKNTVASRIDSWRPDNKADNNPMFGKPQTNQNSLNNLVKGWWSGKTRSCASNLKTSKTMLEKGIKMSQHSLDKRRDTCIKKGLWFVPDDKHYVQYKKYRRKVQYWTDKQAIQQLDNYDKRGRFSYHLDHKFSVKMGFLESIPPRVISDIRNLEFIPYKENIRKGWKSSITKEEVLSYV